MCMVLLMRMYCPLLYSLYTFKRQILFVGIVYFQVVKVFVLSECFVCIVCLHIFIFSHIFAMLADDYLLLTGFRYLSNRN